MIKLTVLGKTVHGKTMQEVKALMFDYIVNPAFVPVEYDEYIVQPGDSMYSIAKRLFGVGERWPEIAKLNRDRVGDARYILPGMVLKLPHMMKL